MRSDRLWSVDSKALRKASFPKYKEKNLLELLSGLLSRRFCSYCDTGKRETLPYRAIKLQHPKEKNICKSRLVCFRENNKNHPTVWPCGLSPSCAFATQLPPQTFTFPKAAAESSAIVTDTPPTGFQWTAGFCFLSIFFVSLRQYFQRKG